MCSRTIGLGGPMTKKDLEELLKVFAKYKRTPIALQMRVEFVLLTISLAEVSEFVTDVTHLMETIDRQLLLLMKTM